MRHNGENAEKLRGRGVRVDLLVALTIALDLWNWATWEVVQFLVKPATEKSGRCRLADLPAVKPFTGPATVFASHCWGANWGTLVAALCAGGRHDRFVWLDIFAVLQRPGNGSGPQLPGRDCRLHRRHRRHVAPHWPHLRGAPV